MLLLLFIGSLFGKSSPIIDFNAFQTKKRLFDTFMYNNEAEQLYTRIWRLYDYVDAFIIVVSNITFTGLKKEVSFEPFTKELEKYQDKIHLAYVPENYTTRFYNKSSMKKAWGNEVSQRNYGFDFAVEELHMTNEDLLFVSDVDEIPTREAMKFILEKPPNDYYVIPGVMYFPYYFHALEKWNWAFVIKYDENKNIDIGRLRNRARVKKRHFAPLKQSSVTHCTYCFKSIEQYRRKLLSFSHTQYGKPPYTTSDWIFKSHYCRKKLRSKEVLEDENDTDWTDLIPNDERLRFLYDPSFRYNISETSYKEEDLPKLCKNQYKREPFKIQDKRNVSKTI